METETHYLDASTVLRILYRRSVPPRLAEADSVLVSSELIAVEVGLAIQRRLVSGDLDANAAARLRLDLAQLLRRLTLFPPGDEVLARAREPFAFAVGLGTALHVATAQVVRDELPTLQYWTWIEEGAAAAASREFVTHGHEKKA
ncbi:MAG: PIN domain-containing protein [Myxococcaceae bacterium]